MNQAPQVSEQPDLQKKPESGIEGKTLRMEARGMLKKQEENFAEHAFNVYKFKELFKGLEDKWEYQEMLEALSVRTALAADLMNEAERLVQEDEKELKKLDI